MQHRFTLLLLSACIVLGSWAQQVKQDILSNPLLSAGNYLPYPGPDNTALTPAPKGYTPFYLSHYGRHGSRYLIDPHDYTDVMNTLARADSLGLLTPEGQHTLTIVRRMYDESLNRYGELTPLGAEQHKGIAKRMIERFPQIFEGKTNIDARSTVVIRCILSMENELQTLLLANPQLQIKQDASEHDMYYMNFNDTTLFNHRWTPEATSAFQEFSHQHIHGQRLAATLFNDTAYVAQNVDTDKLFSQLFNLTGILPNSDLGRHNSLYPLFTKDELYNAWLVSNAFWYIHGGACPLNGGKQPYSQRNLLRNIINQADSCLQFDHPGATLRFGHDTMLLPLVVLLNINGWGKQVGRLDELADADWACHRIFPMGSNLQLVFYRNPKQADNVLVKVLLNENEVSLPDLKPVNRCYYRWSDFRTFFLKKINAFRY